MSLARTHTTTGAARRSAPDFLVVGGMVLTVLALMFRPSAAQALLPSSIFVFPQDSTASDVATVNPDSLPQVTREYDVVMQGDDPADKKTVSLTGVPLVELLKQQGTIDVNKVPFVKIRFGDTQKDSSIMLVTLTGVTDEGPPPMIMDSGTKPGIGKWHTPSFVPGQPGTQPIYETQIRPFDAKQEKVAVVPAKEGAKIMSVSIDKKRKSNGEYLLTANVENPPSNNLTYTWYTDVGETTGKRFATKDVRNSKQKHTVNVVVTANVDGSTGASSFTYLGRKADDGATKDPGYGKSTGDSNGNSSNPGTNNGTNNGLNTGPGQGTNGTTITPQPNSTPVPTTPTTPTQPTTPTTPTQPTEPPKEDQQAPAVDNSGVADLAQNVKSTQPLTTVSGVLLSAPTVTATSPGGGGGTAGPTAGLTPLQQAVASAAESIFKPVEDPGDLWPYIVTLMFAFGFAGAVREWVNP